MRRIPIRSLIQIPIALMLSHCEGFAPTISSPTDTVACRCPSISSYATQDDQLNSVEGMNQRSRRSFVARMGEVVGITMSTTLPMLSFPQSSSAIPMVSMDEFGIILRDSPLSVEVVEFSGPKSETVLVKLVDGTTFGIKDIVESATDPRSPLKVAAACREEGVKTKFVDLEAILATAPKKKKLYTNQRVQEAQEKERARLERIQKDEENRLAQLAKMEEDLAATGK